jgi:hypothetical protein
MVQFDVTSTIASTLDGLERDERPVDTGGLSAVAVTLGRLATVARQNAS